MSSYRSAFCFRLARAAASFCFLASRTASLLDMTFAM